MPAEGNEANYAKIAFMGQVPVKVENYAEPGDYILASGNNDGMGVAVSPLDMAIEDYNRIVGVAWSIKDPEGYANVAVGLTTNDLTNKVVEQAQEIADLQNMFLQVVGVLKGYDQNDDYDIPHSTLLLSEYLWITDIENGRSPILQREPINTPQINSTIRLHSEVTIP